MKVGKIVSDRTRSALKTQINENLKRVYEEALTDEVPDKFKELLDRLKSTEAEK